MRGRVILSHHIPGWDNTPLRDQLQHEFDAPVSIDNDANVAALGEYTFGAGQGCASMLYVTVSTGVGGGFVIDGKIYRGADSMAGGLGADWYYVDDLADADLRRHRHRAAVLHQPGPAADT